jgi:hypothetical protein
MMRPQFVLFGDSITQRGWEDRGWAAGLADAYGRKADVINRGYSGYNSRWALHLLDRVFPAAPAPPPELATVMLGANDAALPELPDRPTCAATAAPGHSAAPPPRSAGSDRRSWAALRWRPAHQQPTPTYPPSTRHTLPPNTLPQGRPARATGRVLIQLEEDSSPPAGHRRARDRADHTAARLGGGASHPCTHGARHGPLPPSGGAAMLGGGARLRTTGPCAC